MRSERRCYSVTTCCSASWLTYFTQQSTQSSIFYLIIHTNSSVTQATFVELCCFFPCFFFSLYFMHLLLFLSLRWIKNSPGSSRVLCSTVVKGLGFFFSLAAWWKVTILHDHKKYSSIRKDRSSILSFFFLFQREKNVVAATQVTGKVNQRLIGVSKWCYQTFSTNAQELLWFP